MTSSPNVGCPDCDSDVVVIEEAPGFLRAEVRHDESCPWLREFLRSGGGGVRFDRFSRYSEDSGPNDPSDRQS